LKYFVDISERRYEIEIDNSSGIARISVNGRPVEVDQCRIRGDESISMIVDGVTHTAEFNKTDGNCRVQVDGSDFEVRVTDERQENISHLFKARGTRVGVPGEIRAPMPGLVVKVNVREGDMVKRGQGVVVVEAMKMENEIQAPIAGRVERIAVETGKTVDKGELLLVIEREA